MSIIPVICHYYLKRNTSSFDGSLPPMSTYPSNIYTLEDFLKYNDACEKQKLLEDAGFYNPNLSKVERDKILNSIIGGIRL